MGKYLTKFTNHSAYSAAESGLDKPNVSLCVQENEVHYNPIPDPYNGHEYVDLGLPSGTKWATMNVGASSITDYGNYYQYGKGAAQYAETSGQSYYRGTENPLATSADTAAQVWGSNWHMPTLTQLNELITNTTYQWVTDYKGSGVNGGKFISQNGNYIFIPAAGYLIETLSDVGVTCCVWGSSPYSSSSAYRFYLNNENALANNYMRAAGYPIRAVIE